MGIKDMVTVKAMQLAPSKKCPTPRGRQLSAHHPHRRRARRNKEAGITPIPQQLDMTEVHDCFSVTELAAMEHWPLDAGRRHQGCARRQVRPRRPGARQIDGGLKCFGHPIGATGLRMAYEMYLQLLGCAGKRQLN